MISNPDNPQHVLNYATVAAFGKLQKQGDSTKQDVLTVEEESNSVR